MTTNTNFSNAGTGYVEADGFQGPDLPGVAPGAGSVATFPNGVSGPAGGPLVAPAGVVGTANGPLIAPDGVSGPAGGPVTFPNGATIPAGTPTGGTVTVTDGIVAHAGGGQANAVALPTTYNRIATVVTAADSAKLEAATVGARQVVRNDGANAAAIFPAAGQTINAAGANASVSLVAGAQAEFVCYTAGAWHGPIAEV